MSCCKKKSSLGNRTWVAGGIAALQWILPSLALAFIPKCPACAAAYIALWTGLGVSFTSATYLRWTLIGIFVASLAVAAWMQLGVLQKILLVLFKLTTWRKKHAT